MNTDKPNAHIKPWRNALVATTALSGFAVVASVLWTSGHPEWAFVLAFLAVWVLISVSWSNVRFTEESGTVLASIVDHNFESLYRRINDLEAELAELRGRATE